MTDSELQEWWPELGTLVMQLRQTSRPDVACLLVDAVRVGSTSSEILENISIVLRENRALRAELGVPGAHAWAAVMGDVHRAYPGSRLGHWIARFTWRMRWRHRG